ALVSLVVAFLARRFVGSRRQAGFLRDSAGVGRLVQRVFGGAGALLAVPLLRFTGSELLLTAVRSVAASIVRALAVMNVVREGVVGTAHPDVSRRAAVLRTTVCKSAQQRTKREPCPRSASSRRERSICHESHLRLQ